MNHSFRTMHPIPRHILILFLLLALSACSRSPRFTSLPSGSVVLAFGDSVTYGTGAAEGEDWPALLAGMTGWRSAAAAM